MPIESKMGHTEDRCVGSPRGARTSLGPEHVTILGRIRPHQALDFSLESTTCYNELMFSRSIEIPRPEEGLTPMSSKLKERKGTGKVAFINPQKQQLATLGTRANLGEDSPAELTQLIRLSKANDINLRSLKKRTVSSRRQIHGSRIVTATSLSSLCLIYLFVVAVF